MSIEERKMDNYDNFLSLPTANELEIIENSQDFVPSIERKTNINYKNTSERFLLSKKTFENQYCGIYFSRLQQLKPWVIEKAKKLWGEKNLPILEKLLDIKDNIECIIIGTLFKEMPLVPRILDQFTKEEKNLIPVPLRENYISKEDKLILEDETGRTLLINYDSTFKTNTVVTGMVVAVKGTSLKGGEFNVDEICFPGLPPQPKITLNLPEPSYYVAFISGIQVGGINQNPLAFQMFVDYITGHLGSFEEENFISNIIRVIIVGNSLVEPEKTIETNNLFTNDKMYIRKKQQNLLTAPLKELDNLLCQLCDSIAVDIMPGENDPANYTLPQQPFKKCLFPEANKFSTFNPVSNPYEFEIDDRIFLGTSGQTINNIEKYMLGDKLTIAEQTLYWRHIVPTAPDLLGCYPFPNYDPFVLNKCPHIYFIGNQKEFQNKIIQGENNQICKIIFIPSFSLTSTILLVNLNNLNIHPITFDISL